MLYAIKIFKKEKKSFVSGMSGGSFRVDPAHIIAFYYNNNNNIVCDKSE